MAREGSNTVPKQQHRQKRALMCKISSSTSECYLLSPLLLCTGLRSPGARPESGACEANAFSNRHHQRICTKVLASRRAATRRRSVVPASKVQPGGSRTQTMRNKYVWGGWEVNRGLILSQNGTRSILDPPTLPLSIVVTLLATTKKVLEQ